MIAAKGLNPICQDAYLTSEPTGEKKDAYLTTPSLDGKREPAAEVDLPIPDKASSSLWRLTQGKRIEKVRYRIPLAGQTVELDVYHGNLSGLMTAEIEFKSDRELRRFRPPQWLGREVTGQDEFSNSRLATRAKPPTVRKS